MRRLYPKINTCQGALPGTAAGESGPERDWATLAGDPTGDGEGPLMPGRWGEVCGEKGDWAGLLCSPWLLEIPDVLTPGLRAPSVPMGRSSIEPDRSCNTQRNRSAKNEETWGYSLIYHQERLHFSLRHTTNWNQWTRFMLLSVTKAAEDRSNWRMSLILLPVSEPDSSPAVLLSVHWWAKQWPNSPACFF